MMKKLSGTKRPITLRRVLPLAVVLVFAAAFFIAPVAADAWDGTVDTTWYNEASNSFTIDSAAELAGLAQLVQQGTTFAEKSFTLTTDIDLNNQEWAPIGTYDSGKNYPFYGSFDGGEHTISNLKISNDHGQCLGLFGYAPAPRYDGVDTIQNIKIHNVDIQSTTGQGAGAVVGYFACGNNAKGIVNCHVTGTITIKLSYADAFVGGIVGNNQKYGTSDCSVKGIITLEGGEVGGIAGRNFASVSGCTVEGTDGSTIKATSTDKYAGGIIGYNLMNAEAGIRTVKNCQVSGVTIEGANAGGVAGKIDGSETWNVLGATSIVQGCTISNVEVKASTENVGTIVGKNMGNAGTFIIDNTVQNTVKAYHNDNEVQQVSGSSDTTIIGLEGSKIADITQVGGTWVGGAYSGNFAKIGSATTAGTMTDTDKKLIAPNSFVTSENDASPIVIGHAVASVDGTTYTTLQAAINAVAEQGTVVLQENVEENVNIDKQITLNIGNNFVKGTVTIAKEVPLTIVNTGTMNAAMVLETPSNADFTFKGWYSTSNFDDSASHWGANSMYLKEGTITYYQKWVSVITLKPNGATNNVNDVTQEILKGDTTTPFDATPYGRTGYSFAGWNTAADGTGTSYNVGDTNVGANGNIVLYAQWTANEYSIVYNPNGGTIPDDAPTTHTYGVDTELPTPTMEGNEFKGWYTDAQFAEGTHVETIAADAYSGQTTVPINLYAKWEISKYTVIWKYDNGTVIDEQELAYNSDTPTIADPEMDATAQYSYTFIRWEPTITEKVTADATYIAKFDKTVNTYTVTWMGATGVIETDNNVPYGNTPSFDGAVPTKDDDGTNWYVFDKWDKEIAQVTGDITYTAVFTPVAIPPTDDASTEPLFPLGVMTNDDTGKTSLAAAGDNTFTIQQDGQTAKLEDERGVVTLAIKFNGNIGQPGDTLTTLSGVINEIIAEYSETSLVSAEGVGTVKSLVNLALLDTILKNIDALSEIQDELQQGIITKVKDKYPNINPSAMVAVDDSIDNYLETGNSVELTFLFNRTWADANIAAGKLWWFHLHGNNAPVFTQIKATDLQSADAENYRLRLSVSGFSTYGLATGELTTNQQGGGGDQNTNNGGGSSTPQGSSVWLQEPLTPTPTETAQPTPTDVAPTDIPTTQPTETPKTPGFGALAVLAGLGAVAVLRRK